MKTGITTSEDRDFAHAQAGRIHQKLLLVHGSDPRYGTAHTGEEILYRGILTECAFARKSGLKVDDKLYRGGDGGKDFLMRLSTPQGVRSFKVNVKTKTVKQDLESYVRFGTHLRVPVRECQPLTIYVFGVYYPQDDTADVLRWDWGSALIKENDRRIFPTGNIENYVKDFKTLRELEELFERLVRGEAA